MNIISKRFTAGTVNDANLVMSSLGGDRDAFCQIVTRYQNLLCSLAYSAVGDIKHSEDIAQETFVDAWKKLDTLQDPEMLKAWLCGILRFKISRFRRSETKHQTHKTSDVEQSQLDSSASSELENEAISEQQQLLLWKVLNTIDTTYREPLILFYREQQSVECVAQELDITTDNAKQRLSRGRKLLKQAMSSFVEDSLARSIPGIAFTTGVMALIGSTPSPAKAAVVGTGVTKTGSAFKLTSVLVVLASVSGLISAYFGIKAGFAQSRTKREKRLVIKMVILYLSSALIFVVGMFVLQYIAGQQPEQALICSILSQLLVITFVITYIILIFYNFSVTKRLRAQERIFQPQAFEKVPHQGDAKEREYVSKFSLFGIPLIHMQFGMPESGDKPAFGWIAGGSFAYGLLFAWGGVAVAPISVGIISVGIISIGAIGVGICALGTVAIGYFGFGASAVAYKAFGSLSALGWESAISGGFSIAKQAAIAPFAFATEVNNEKAAEIGNLATLNDSLPWLLGTIAVLVIVPAIWHSKKVQQRMR